MSTPPVDSRDAEDDEVPSLRTGDWMTWLLVTLIAVMLLAAGIRVFGEMGKTARSVMGGG